jgi:hypothetical protein
MPLFRNKNRPIAYHELRVGKSHLLEVMLHLRRADWDWFQSHEQDVEEELLELLEESVVPRMFGDLIENYHARRNPKFLPPDKLTVGSKNNKSAKNPQKRKPRKGSKNKAAASASPVVEEKKPDKDVYFSFGELIQLAFRKQDTSSSSSGRTIFYKTKSDNDDTTTSLFEDCPKLPHRLLIWISKIDPQNKVNPDPSGVGFYRPEMIPISSLFREPKDEEIDVDD